MVNQKRLKINKDFEYVFTERPIIAFRQNRNLQNILGKKTSVNRTAVSNIDQNGVLGSYNSKLNNLWCTQVTSTFKSTVTYKTFEIYSKVNCKIKYLMYLIECILCNKRYTGKSETTFKAKQPSKRCK